MSSSMVCPDDHELQLAETKVQSFACLPSHPGLLGLAVGVGLVGLAEVVNSLPGGFFCGDLHVVASKCCPLRVGKLNNLASTTIQIHVEQLPLLCLRLGVAQVGLDLRLGFLVGPQACFPAELI
eukprot:7245045-Heterocapsa_arctica.AAC.1